MISARMDEQIVLRSVSTTTDDYGQAVETYSDDITVFANVTRQGGKEIFKSGKVSEVDTVFKIRWFSDIDETWQIVYDNTTYKIVGKPKELGRRDGVEIIGKAQE